MNIGILTEGAFSAFQSTNWRSRLAILTCGAFTPFLEEEIAEILAIGIRDKGFIRISDLNIYDNIEVR